MLLLSGYLDEVGGDVNLPFFWSRAIIRFLNTDCADPLGRTARRCCRCLRQAAASTTTVVVTSSSTAMAGDVSLVSLLEDGVSSFDNKVGGRGVDLLGAICFSRYADRCSSLSVLKAGRPGVTSKMVEITTNMKLTGRWCCRPRLPATTGRWSRRSRFALTSTHVRRLQQEGNCVQPSSSRDVVAKKHQLNDRGGRVASLLLCFKLYMQKKKKMQNSRGKQEAFITFHNNATAGTSGSIPFSSVTTSVYCSPYCPIRAQEGIELGVSFQIPDRSMQRFSTERSGISIIVPVLYVNRYQCFTGSCRELLKVCLEVLHRREKQEGV